MSTLLTDKEYLLEKFSGKGGWTYIALPDLHSQHCYGGTKVSGSIDGHSIEPTHLLPMGNGILFLAINAGIRRRIKKEQGDTAHLILYSEELPPVSEDDFAICFQDEPRAWNYFNQLPWKEQKKWRDWVYSVKNDDLRVERIAELINRFAVISY